MSESALTMLTVTVMPGKVTAMIKMQFRPHRQLHSSKLLVMCLACGLTWLGVVSDAQERPQREMNSVATADETSVVAIVGGRLIDGRGGEPLEDACVLIHGGRIERVGKRSEVHVPDEASLVDATGQSVLPGLLDSHFHSRDTTATPVEFELQNGITSFRDPGHPFRFYDVYLQSSETLPRLFLCGGHLDAEPAVWPDQAVVIASAAEAREAVSSHVQRGASAIKIYFRLPVESIRAACEAAAEHGVLVTAHLELVAADEAIRAGVRGIEHITSFGTVLADPHDAAQFQSVVEANSNARREWRHRLWQRIPRDNNPRLDQLVALIVNKGVFVSPTLAIFESRADDDESTPETVAGFENMMWFFQECHRAGAKIVVGSHTSAPYAPKGKAYLREMQLMAEAGMRPLEIITAATKTNAKFFGVQERLGTIEAGKLADLILVDGNPAEDISQIDRVARVMLGGNWVVP